MLYPNDEQARGKELRLEQQYFFVSCSLQDMMRILRTQKLAVNQFHLKFAVQLNDTHPAVAIAELMRLLIDEALLSWAEAWEHYAPDLRLYQSYVAAGGLGALAGRSVRPRAAAAAADHL